MARHLVTVSYGLPRKGLPAAASVRRWVEAALAGQRRAIELSVRYVDSDEGRALNRDYRGKDYATNVLSFPVELPPGVRSPLLGDLVICAPVVALEALGQDKPLAHHHAHLVVHGVLHLLGMDHERSEAEADAMEARERTILGRLGIPDPYAER
ncbi:rRNA maturation RNase YbeY [Silanimonas sp.]|jgi:probable rRNA maturation factor|uniref:rRNA maturation RNase YbeY n=1 Tax=Silanimonas sp. TaxID=1929290 RepID=UPI0022CD0FAD|nr:rRNA maturation RNase YbeY [Silanimonas sp.]MCZ8115922.1 rRNA maturation RNase YbeY [Silanimonas sp.]